ncbi:SMI1/KNR4 family protein [Kitasatospora sp. NPDC006697]|uniref:SMI1/KNR4 family protein n=1 Tax=Kitasatospora sp. NPDC006697 TaxID=3364020 RepID=UPI0036B39738
MNGISDLVRRVDDRAQRERGQLPARISEQALTAAEHVLGFALPPVLRLLYSRVANGGFGPGHLLLPLAGDGRTVLSEYGHLRTAGREFWPRGVLPILDRGCGRYAGVDCLDPAAPVLLFEPNGGPADWADAWFLDSSSLTRWLVSWLDGTGWWAGVGEPGRWPAASERLGAGVGVGE